jgi:hypothetical protein
MSAPATPTRQLATACLVIALALAWAPATASVRVDDSGTIVSAPVVAMRWRQLVPGRGADHTVEAQLRVALRLNLAPWLNQHVRLYMVLPATGNEPVLASWRTQGRLLAGTLRSGARTLVYQGQVTAPVLEETIDLSLATDGRALITPQSLQFSFELDTP